MTRYDILLNKKPKANPTEANPDQSCMTCFEVKSVIDTIDTRYMRSDSDLHKVRYYLEKQLLNKISSLINYSQYDDPLTLQTTVTASINIQR